MGTERTLAQDATAPREAEDIAVVRDVLKTEAEAVAAMSACLDAGLGTSVSAALDLLEKARGRIVVTGMGKSGHIGNKIAATLASTGSPSLYVHPGEASHGDLGMIARDDAIIALSYSGNTAELDDTIAYSRRYAIPLIAIAGQRKSTLAEAADVALILPQSPEACPMGLAPTTSTTLMLALGDALAVALLSRKGFTKDDYRLLHPGGSLGRRLLRVTDLMHGHQEVPLCAPGTLMSEAILIMTEKTFGCIGVTDSDGRLAGIVTDGDLRRHMGPALLNLTVAEVMTAKPKTIRAQALAVEALGIMNRNAITTLFVVEADQPVGIIRVHDCLRAGIA